VYIVDGLQAYKATIPGGVHAAAWCVAALAAPLPFLSPPRTLPRFTSVYMAAAAVYALFSVSYESLFYAALGAAALAWLALERCCQKLAAAGLGGLPSLAAANNKSGEAGAGAGARAGGRAGAGAEGEGESESAGEGEGEGAGDEDVDVASCSEQLRGLQVGDVRHTMVFLVLINAAFFGTGNIASVASFEISSVYRFTTRFNPFLMGALLMLKVGRGRCKFTPG